jgi:hypothetical protein
MLISYWSDIKKFFSRLFGKDKKYHIHKDWVDEDNKLSDAVANFKEKVTEINETPESVTYVMDKGVLNVPDKFKPKEFDGKFEGFEINAFIPSDIERANTLIQEEQAKPEDEILFKFTDDGELILGEESGFSMSQAKLNHIKKVMYTKVKPKKNVNRE